MIHDKKDGSIVIIYLPSVSESACIYVLRQRVSEWSCNIRQYAAVVVSVLKMATLHKMTLHSK